MTHIPQHWSIATIVILFIPAFIHQIHHPAQPAGWAGGWAGYIAIIASYSAIAKFLIVHRATCHVDYAGLPATSKTCQNCTKHPKLYT